MNARQLLKRIAPPALLSAMRDLRDRWKLLPNAWYDYRRYLRYSGMNEGRQVGNEMAARLTMSYHQIEKGLSLAVPRPGFGVAAVDRIFRQLPVVMETRGAQAPATVAVRVLQQYIDFNEAHACDMAEVRRRLAALEARFGPAIYANCEGGTRSVERADVQRAAAIDFRAFFSARHSVRDFAPGAISSDEIAAAVRVAMKTPSVCNRQAFRVHAYIDAEMKRQLLAVQAGARGFGESAAVVLVITCDLTCFVNVSERYQAWIDGGMFSMSMCLALHAAGFGSCCLNWSKEWRDDMALRRIAGIPSHEQVIMLMAVGHLPERFSVAASARQPVDQVLRVHQRV